MLLKVWKNHSELRGRQVLLFWDWGYLLQEHRGRARVGRMWAALAKECAKTVDNVHESHACAHSCMRACMHACMHASTRQLGRGGAAQQHTHTTLIKGSGGTLKRVVLRKEGGCEGQGVLPFPAQPCPSSELFVLGGEGARSRASVVSELRWHQHQRHKIRAQTTCRVEPADCGNQRTVVNLLDR